ncbi:MAG: DUF5719 family protein [Acidimicrobiia bacterium]
MRGRRARVMVVVVLLLGGAVVLDQVVAEPTPPAGDGNDSELPSGDELSASWFCAEGTSAPDGRAEESILVANLGTDEVEALVTVMPGGDEGPVTDTIAVPPGTTSRLDIADVLETAEPGVVVETFGGPAVVEHELRGSNDLAVGPCARGPETRWLFAAGTTIRNSSQFLALFNPFGEDAIVDVTYFSEGGPEVIEAVQGLVVPRRSRVTVPVHEHVRREGTVGIDVRARAGRIVAERSMVFDGTEEGLEGLAVSLGGPAPANEWWFPYGDAAGGSDVRVAVANPNDTPADVEVTTLLQGGDDVGQPQQVVVAPQSSSVIDLDQVVQSADAYGVIVRSPASEVVAEQLVGWSAGDERGAATLLGSPAPSERWAFATARLPEDDGGIAVVNPGSDVTHVAVVAYDGGAERIIEEIDLAPGERHVFDAGSLNLPEDVPVAVVANHPVVVARAAFIGRGATLSPGVPA